MLALGALLLTLSGVTPGVAGACAGLIAVILLPLWMRPELRRHAFHPYAYFLFASIIAFGFPSLLIIADSNLYDEQSSTFALALILLALAFLGYWLGFRSAVGARLARAVPLLTFESAPPNLPFFTGVVLLYVIGWAGRLARAEIGFSHLPADLAAGWSTVGVLGDLHLFATLSYAVLLYHLLRTPPPALASRALVLGLVCAEVTAGALYGGRTAIAIPILQFLAVFHFAVRPVRWRLLILGYCGAMVIVAPLLTIYRDSFYGLLRQGLLPGFETTSLAVGSVVETAGAGDFSWSTALDQVLGSRTTTVMGTLAVLEKVPLQYEFQKGGTFAPALASILIPRVLWPEKPVFVPNRDFAAHFFGYDDTQLLGTSVGIGMPAEAYYNFGWFGLLMFPAFGVMLRFFSERLTEYQRIEQVAIVRTFFVLFFVASLSSAFLYYFGGLLRQGGLHLIFLIVATRRLPTIRWIQEPDRALARALVQTRRPLT